VGDAIQLSTEGAYGGTQCADMNEVVFALRRGDRRVLQILQAGQSYGGSMREAIIVISETWLEDDPGPIVTLNEPF